MRSGLALRGSIRANPDETRFLDFHRRNSKYVQFSSTPPVLQRFTFFLPWMQPWTLEFETSGFVLFVQNMKMTE